MQYELERDKSGPTGEPSLAEMTRKAIQVLQNTESGFFLMVEGIYEPQCDKTYLLRCVPNEDSDQRAHSRSLIRLFVIRFEKLCILGYPNMCKRKILIRVRICAGWSESSLAARLMVRFQTLRIEYSLFLINFIISSTAMPFQRHRKVRMFYVHRNVHFLYYNCWNVFFPAQQTPSKKGSTL